MSETPQTNEPPGRLSREEMMSVLFAQMVIQQSNMAMMLLGKTAHPQTGEKMRDTDAAQIFIDQLEMLQAKTKGNLSKEEEGLLKQSLMSLRMAFVEAVAEEEKAGGAAAPAEGAKGSDAHASPAAGGAGQSPTETQVSGTESESRKKFTKKY